MADKSMVTALITAAFLAFLVIAGYALFYSDLWRNRIDLYEEKTSAPAGSAETAGSASGRTNRKLIPSGLVEDGVRMIGLETAGETFVPNPVVALRGEKIRLVMEDGGSVQALAVPDFDVAGAAGPDNAVVMEFTADKTGTYKLRGFADCRPGSSPVRGEIVILPPGEN